MTERAIVIHSLEHARTAVAVAAELGVPVTLASAPGAAAYLGPQWFAQVVAEAAASHPDVRVTGLLDCGGEPGHALAALRQGLKRIRFTGSTSTAAKLSGIARRQGAELERGRLMALDLLDNPDIEGACHRWLAPRAVRQRS
jgi:fructose/tagatose bisphosphate aldolase